MKLKLVLILATLSIGLMATGCNKDTVNNTEIVTPVEDFNDIEEFTEEGFEEEEQFTDIPDEVDPFAENIADESIDEEVTETVEGNKVDEFLEELPTTELKDIDEAVEELKEVMIEEQDKQKDEVPKEETSSNKTTTKQKLAVGDIQLPSGLK